MRLFAVHKNHTHSGAIGGVSFSPVEYFAILCTVLNESCVFFSFVLYFNMIMDWNLMHFHCIEFSHFDSWDFPWKFTRFIEFSFPLFDHILVLSFFFLLNFIHSRMQRSNDINEWCATKRAHIQSILVILIFIWCWKCRMRDKKRQSNNNNNKKRKFKFIHSICGMAKLPVDYPIDQLTVASNIHRL